MLLWRGRWMSNFGARPEIIWHNIYCLPAALLRRSPRPERGAAASSPFGATKRASGASLAFLAAATLSGPNGHTEFTRMATRDATLAGDSGPDTTIGGRNLQLEIVLAAAPIGSRGSKRRSWRAATRLGAESSIGDSAGNDSNWKAWAQMSPLAIVAAVSVESQDGPCLDQHNPRPLPMFMRTVSIFISK